MRTTIIFLLFITTIACKAQSDSVKVYDLTVLKNIATEYSYNSDSSIVTKSDSIQWNIQFKITNQDSLMDITIEIGSTKDGNEIYNETFMRVKQNGQNYLSKNGNNLCKILDNSISFVKTTRYVTSKNASWLSVKAKHLNGNFSEKIYFKIK